MRVNTYLRNLASELVLSSGEESRISTSVNTIISRLSVYFNNDIEEKKVFGSYTRGTILPRRDDENSDIDLMVVFKNPCNYRPQTFLRWLKEFAESRYDRSEVYQSSPTIVLELNHIKFELTPSHRYADNCYAIPDGPSNWMCTDPDGFWGVLTTCNRANSYKIKPVIRLLKHWNIQKNNRGEVSFLLEKHIAENMINAHTYCTYYTDYLREALTIIRSDNNMSKVDTAIDCINTALCYEGMEFKDRALLEIKKVFPEVGRH